MEDQEILDDTLFAEGKVFTKSHIIWAAVFGGPLSIAFMFSRNFKLFGQPNLAVRAWLIAFSIYLGVLFLSSELPAMENIPSIVYTLAFAFISNKFFMSYQAFKVYDHLENNGKTHRGMTVFLVIIVGFIATVALLIGYVYLLDPEGLKLLWEQMNER